LCLTIPGRVIKIKGDYATIDYGSDGIRAGINISMVPVRIGAYVLVQGGVVVRVLGEEEAREALKVWKTIESELKD